MAATRSGRDTSTRVQWRSSPWDSEQPRRLSAALDSGMERQSSLLLMRGPGVRRVMGSSNL